MDDKDRRFIENTRRAIARSQAQRHREQNRHLKRAVQNLRRDLPKFRQTPPPGTKALFNSSKISYQKEQIHPAVSQYDINHWRVKMPWDR